VKERDVPLTRISLKERRFSFSRGESIDDLAESIRETGLLVPPDLLLENDRYTVIRGFRRLHALRRLRFRRVMARVFEPGEISPLEAWSTNFFENRSGRALNPAEACTALRQLTTIGLSPDEIRTKYAPLLDLPLQGEGLAPLLAVADLPEKMLDALARGEMTLPSALYLAKLDEGGRRSAFRFLAKAGLTVSQQRQWARLTSDLAARDRVPAAKVLSSASRAAARRGGRFGEAVMQILRERRYPALAAARRTFLKILRDLRLPPHVQITTHPTFEKRGLTARFSVSNREEYTDVLRLLKKAGDDDAVIRFLDPEKKGSGE
jgi:ParB-like chromosome segregation protein Spo0J